MTRCTIISTDRCSLNDGPGIRTVIFFKGCHLRCAWCHNPESYRFEVQSYEHDGKRGVFGRIVEVAELCELIERDVDYYRASGGGVTLSGGEALLQIEACEEIGRFCRERGIDLCVETSGHVRWEDIERMRRLVGTWLYDYKLTREEDYRTYVKADSHLMLSNLRRLIELGDRIVLRCPIIPGINDNDEHFRRIAELSANVVGVEILPYHNLGKTKAEKLGIEGYFVQENAQQEAKDSWRERLLGFGCERLVIR